MNKETQTTELNMERTETEKNEEELVKQADLDSCRNIRLYFREYCQNSSLHGIRYLGEKGRTKTERVWWFLFLIASIFMCSHLIRKTWQKWESMPVIIGFAESPTHVWQIPFPAVTICFQTKIRQTVYNFTAAYHKRDKENMTEEEEKQYADASLICDSHLYTTGENTTDQSAIDFIHDVAPEFEELLWSCIWFNNINASCENLFSKSLTEDGLCYTFNMLDSKEVLKEEVQNELHLNHGISSDWSLDKGYRKGSDKDVYPMRTYSSGIKAGMSILLRAYDQDFEYICNGPFQGFKIFLHNSNELPRAGLHFNIKASWNHEVNVAVQPDIVTASNGLKDYHSSRRNCFFPKEKELRYFKIYTQSNCEVECLTNYTLGKCGCVAFHMPRTKDTSICGSGSIPCVVRAQKLFERNTPLNYFSLLKKILPRSIWNDKWMKNFVTPYFIPISEKFHLKELRGDLEESYIDPEDVTSEKCNCFPGCTSLAYNAESSQTDFNFVKLFESFGSDIIETPGIQLSRVQIFFKDTQFMTWRRSELYDQTDFLASCGGLLGLFMGFSFLSLVEIAYFLTLRIWCNIKMHRRRIWNTVKIGRK